MQNITVGRYGEAGSESHGYAGWIEPKDRSWIIFVKNDHSAEVYLNRDRKTGAVL